MDRCRHRHGQARHHNRHDRESLAQSPGFRLRQRDGGVWPAVRARPGPGVARAAHHQPAQPDRPPGRAASRQGSRARDLLPGLRRPFGGPHRGGNRGDRDGARGDHPLPRRATRHRERLLSTRVEKPPAAEIDRPTRLQLYQLMVELRDFEQRAYELFLENLVRGTSHLALGQEAISAGYAVAMRADDYTFCTYRGHGHTLARGASMAAAMAELLGRGNGMLHGNDADVMYERARQTIDTARNGGGPSLVEALTYRHGGHSRADPAKYRPDAEVREWLSRDPVTRYRERLLAAGIGEAEVNEIETRAQQKVDAATEEARNGAPATVDAIERQVWSDGGAAWRN